MQTNNLIQNYEATVISNEPVGRDLKFQYRKLRIQVPHFTPPLPGQFLMLDLSKLSAFTAAEEKRTYLKRPYGIHRIHHASSATPILDLFIKLLEDGSGSEILKTLLPGMNLSITAPLGNGLNLSTQSNRPFNKAHIVGGGVGMAPLTYLAQQLTKRGVEVEIFLGVESSNFFGHYDALSKKELSYIYIDDFLDLGIPKSSIHLCTDKKIENGPRSLSDIPLTEECFVPNLYENWTDSNAHLANHQEEIQVFTCGPNIMMKNLFDVTKRKNLPLTVFMEKRMGCGTGVCFSCVCKTQKENVKKNSRVCVEGPVFDATEIVWEENL